ncbi:MAG: hypothetical protein HYX37_01620 [Rhizobiales bacterium]|jgi:hypothetical protein|nr:hypothetical protein [Hyphomicrobiales bacterium]
MIMISANWISALRIYLSASAGGHLVWEILQLPLYTIWTAQFRDQAFAVIHCTLGDLLIALSTLVATLVAVANPAWPRDRFWRVATVTMLLGVSYTIFSEWLNVVVRASWAYSEWMPVVSIFGLHVGLSPIFQWVVIPATAFTITQKRMVRAKFV